MQKNNPVNHQYEQLLNSREDFTCTLRNFTCIILSITVQGVQLTVYKKLKQ